MKRLIYSLLSLLIFSLPLAAQHRDESQMLWKHGERLPVVSKAQLDSIKRSQSLLTSYENLTGDGADFLKEGVELLEINDAIGALKAFNKASQRGNHEAQYRIGLMYRDGVGISKDDKEAAYWFRKAASNGHVESEYEIGLCFLQGRGVLQDMRVGAEWLWRAADNGHARSALYVARMYRDGKGMNKDLRKALRYMRLAAESGEEEAIKELPELEKAAASGAPQSKQRGKR